MSLERDLLLLRSVVEVVIAETPRTSQRVRLLAPWVDGVRRRGASWRQLVPVLSPICSLADELKTETRLSQIFAVAAKRRPKSAVDLDVWRGAVAEAAGVDLPVTARPVDNGSILVPARFVGLLEKMADGLRPSSPIAGASLALQSAPKIPPAVSTQQPAQLAAPATAQSGQRRSLTAAVHEQESRIPRLRTAEEKAASIAEIERRERERVGYAPSTSESEGD
jgi:hypothetical protein